MICVHNHRPKSDMNLPKYQSLVRGQLTRQVHLFLLFRTIPYFDLIPLVFDIVFPIVMSWVDPIMLTGSIILDNRAMECN